MGASERKAFKLWFDEALVHDLAARLHAALGAFDREAFVARASAGLDALEMSGRVGQIADALHAALPRPTAAAMATLTASLPPPAPQAEGVTEQGYRFWPYGEYIARYGLDDVDASFGAMVALTERFTSEFAVRPFLAADPDDTLDRLEALVEHPSEHVRRWISEGTRTRLPWARRIPALEAHTARRLSLLDRLRLDPSRYVQRSVANHLQDALKDDREAALPTLRRWAAEGRAGTDWVARHAARGLLKQGDPEVLALFGLEPGAAEVVAFTVEPAVVCVGERVRLRATVANPSARAAAVRIDYVLTSPGARPERPSQRVFRLADLALGSGERATAGREHDFTPRSVRPVRPGVHRLTLRVNGRDLATAHVTVEAAETG